MSPDGGRQRRGSQKAPLIIVKPQKPIREMTEDEFNDWSKAVYHEMVDRCEKAKGEASDPPATGSPGARGEGCGCSSAASKEAIGDAASGRWLTGVAPGSPTRREEGSPRA